MFRFLPEAACFSDGVRCFVNDANANIEPTLSPGAFKLPPDLSDHWSHDADPTLAPVFEDFTDRMLGEFRLLRLLGRGGMAEVYLADQTSLSRKVALKILRPELKANTVFLKRFEREARAAASLSHPNLVQVFLVGEVEGFHFIAQEYVKGLNLREYLLRKGPPSTQLALHFMKQVLMALERAGSEGIVHRDVKPENIMITPKGIIKVADFGLAQLVRADVEKSGLELTQVGTTMGTPLYMSPEQVHGQKLDQRSDLYSFGVTCFHMLTGEPPFRGETAMSVAIQHLNQAPPRLKDKRPDLPPALCQIVHKLMAKDPEDRYPDAASVLKDVKQVQAALKAEIDPQSLRLSGIDWDLDDAGQSGWLKKFSRWSLWRKMAAYGFVCLVLAGLSAAWGFWTRPQDPLSQPAADQPLITIKSTAKEQFDLARYNQDHNELLAPNEVAWKAVIDNFPNDTESRYPAMEELGVLYLRMLRLDEAAIVFGKLENVEDGPLAAEYRAKGIAGQAVVARFRGDTTRVAELLEQLKTLPEISYLSPLKEWVDKLREEMPPNNEADSG